MLVFLEGEATLSLPPRRTSEGEEGHALREERGERCSSGFSGGAFFTSLRKRRKAPAEGGGERIPTEKSVQKERSRGKAA